MKRETDVLFFILYDYDLNKSWKILNLKMWTSAEKCVLKAISYFQFTQKFYDLCIKTLPIYISPWCLIYSKNSWDNSYNRRGWNFSFQVSREL